jgi:hypothetical protein
MKHQSRIDGMSQPHCPLVGTQIPAHKDRQQIDRLLQTLVLAIPAPCPQSSGMLAMGTNLHHLSDLKFAVSPMTTHRVAAPTIPPSSQFVMIGMMKMSGISRSSIVNS